MWYRTYRIFSSLFFFLLLWSVLSVSVNLAHAQTAQTQTDDFGLGVANAVEIAGQDVPEGSIVSFSQEEGYLVSNREYDPTVYGIVTDNPAVTMEVIDGTDPSIRYVVTTGKALVRVSSINGPILTGDLVTASEIPGVGMRAVKDGYVIGTALEDYTNENTEDVGTIIVNLNIAYNTNTQELRSNLLENLDMAFSAPFLTPTSTLRYLLAGLALLIAFAIGMGYFGRVTQTGVEALGRNPLAGRSILVSVIINMLLALVTIAAGVAVGYLILVL